MTQQIIATRYEIIEAIGRGGMGIVYRGRDTQTGELVAIKHLKPDLVNENLELLERFVREGNLLRQLNHPNIVTMLGAIEEAGNHYIIMEYVSGGSLKDLLDREEQLSVRRALEIALDLADALTRTHRLQITHRDLKPANVLISEDGTPRLTDFGIARDEKSVNKLTATGSLMGTYHYLSPEACSGETLDPRSDIWSFGIMLFEMLAGELPFEGKHEAAVLLAILNNPAPDLKQIRPEVPPTLAELIEQMLIKDRNQRIDSIRLVGAELEAILRQVNQQADTSLPASSDHIPPKSRFSTPTPSQSIQVSVDPTFITTPGPSIPAIPAGFAKPGRSIWLWSGMAIAVAAIIIMAVLVLGGIFKGSSKRQSDNPSNDGEENAPLMVVENPEEGKLVVLVAQLEPINTIERDASRFIIDDLRQRLVREIPFSDVLIVGYPAIITTDEEAQAAAQVNNAPAIVWGNYSSDLIELEIQVGSTATFAEMPIPRQQIEEVANVRVRLTDERRQSIAPQVVGVLTTLQSADGNGYEVLRNLAIVAELNVNQAEIVGNSPAAYAHRYFRLLTTDTTASLAEITAAQQILPGNPLLYVESAAAYARLGRFRELQDDIESTRRLNASSAWATPLYLQANIALAQGDIAQAIALYDQIITLRPDDWFPYNFRGALYYLQEDYEKSKADYTIALTLSPNANFPYPFSVSLALREGDFARAQQLMREVVGKYPDPSLGNRTIQAAFGDRFPIPFGSFFAAFGYLVLAQYTDVLSDIEAGLALDDQFTELYFLQGLAYCNIRDYEAAEIAYTRAIELDPDFTVLYFLRSEARVYLGNLTGANEDIAIVQNSPLAEKLAPYVQAGLTGDLTCENFFSYQLPQ
jgi:serine/threonine protein kinase/tetratricopeptide (TPR) repeat protein